MQTDLPIIDSSLSLDEALTGIVIPPDVRDDLTIIDVRYISFDNQLHQGQLVVHVDVANEAKDIFDEILKLRFPIEHAIPICAYNWDDEQSMRTNNTSAFNYRVIYGTTQVSNHSRGLAIDINTRLNPCTAIDGTLQPANGSHDPEIPGTLTADSLIVKLFIDRGWRWLGHRERKDWQHFDKTHVA